MMAAAGKTLGGVRCDPSTALKILEADGETLYRTKSRKFFLYTAENGTIELVGDEIARDMIEHYAPEMLGIAFDKEPIIRVVLELPESVVKKIDALRGPRSRKAVFLEAVKLYTEAAEKTTQSDAAGGLR